MIVSEFLSTSIYYNAAPDISLRPWGYGSYGTLPATYFIVHEYGGWSDNDRPTQEYAPELAKAVSDMHQRSQWPGGKFGMAHTLFGGNSRSYWPPADSWEDCFSRGMRHEFDQERRVQGSDPEFDFLTAAILDRVIPRLIGPLETMGNSIVPTLVHGDMWTGNTAVHPKTKRPVLFDATPLYAHFECTCHPSFFPPLPSRFPLRFAF